MHGSINSDLYATRNLTMNSFVNRFASSNSVLSRIKNAESDHDGSGDSPWNSTRGYNAIGRLTVPSFTMPAVHDVSLSLALESTLR